MTQTGCTRIAHMLLLILTLWSSNLQRAAALYAKGSDVLMLDDKSLSKLLGSDGVAAIEFFAPWCGHCKALAPQWEKAASNLKGIATLGAVDCDDKSNAAICNRYGIQGFPSIMLFGPEQQKNPYTGEVTKEPQEYKGPRTAKAVVNALTALLSDVHVKRLKDKSELAAFLDQEPDHNKVVLLSEKKDVSLLYKSLSTQLHKHMLFAQVHKEAVPEAAQILGLQEDSTLPAVVVIKADSGDKHVYDQPLKAPTLKKFLSQYAPATASEDKKRGQEDKTGKGKEHNDRVTFNTTTLAGLTELDEHEDMALVALYVSDSHDTCSGLVAKVEKSAKDLHGILPLLAVNITANDLSQVQRYDLDQSVLVKEVVEAKCAVRLVLLPFGADKIELEDYLVYPSHDPLDSKAVYTWVTGNIPTEVFTVEVTPSILMRFAALRTSQADEVEGSDGLPPFVPPKVLLFTNKDEVPGLFRALAMSFRNRMPGLAFGWTRAHEPSGKQVAQTIKPPKIPSMVMIVPMPDDKVPEGKVSEGSVAMSTQLYPGPNNFKSMQAWVEQMVSLLETMYGIGAGGDSVPQITSDADLQTHCVNKGAGLCVLGMLTSSDPQRVKPWTSLLSKVARKFSGQPLYFSWLDATQFREFASECGVSSPSDLPTVVALSAKRLRVAVLPGALSSGAEGVSALDHFLDNVLGGRARTQMLQALPKLTEGDAASAPPTSEEGSDSERVPVSEADVPVVEEEFDLSDIMSEKVEGEDIVMSKEERLRQLDAELEAEEDARRQEEAKASSKSKSKKSKKSKKKKKSAAKEEL